MLNKQWRHATGHFYLKMHVGGAPEDTLRQQMSAGGTPSVILHCKVCGGATPLMICDGNIPVGQF